MPPQQRQQLMPDAVPLKIEAFIACVLPKPDLSFSGELPQGRLGKIQERADQEDLTIARRRTLPFHSSQSLTTAASEQSLKKQLKLIIRVMRQGHSRDSPPQGCPGQKIVTQLSGGHFQRQLLLSSAFPHIRPFDNDRQ